VWCGRNWLEVTSRIQRKTGRRFILV